MSPRRLDSGGVVDRGRPVRFRYGGRNLTGFAGDTLASALLAQGGGVLARSFKFHRPRGLLAAGVEEPNVLVDVRAEGQMRVNLRATEVELVDGLDAQPVNCWPGARFDVGAVNDVLGRFIPAGFYYKTMMWPDWRVFEPVIRRAAGLGRPSAEPDERSYEHGYLHCDVLVVGSGPAGLAAALAASSTRARVILAEQEPRLGGSLRWRGGEIDALPAALWADRAAQTLARRPEATVLTRTTVQGYFDHNLLALVQRAEPGVGAPQRLWEVRAGRVILATGALERPIAFPGNDRPGVMLTSAAHRYLGEFGVLAGDRTVIFTNNSSAYPTAVALSAAGSRVTVVDSRPSRPELTAMAAKAQLTLMNDSRVVATSGRHGLRSVTVEGAGKRQVVLPADLLLMSGGWNPTVHLFCQSGGEIAWDHVLGAFRPGASRQAEASVGAAAGAFRLAEGLAQGRDEGLAAAVAAGHGGACRLPKASGQDEPSHDVAPLWRVEGRGKAFVDFQNDVSTDDIALAARENYVSVEHLKRYTTLGMAVDQGKTSNVNGLAIMADLTGRQIPEVGATRYRFPYTPVEIGAFAGQARGERFRPQRRTPAHEWHAAHGAMFEEYGGWLRPACYLREGETAREAEQREALAVRTACGVFDASPLGKIEVSGPDAARFLDRIYANTMSTLQPGRLRYGLMLNELGVVFDDGVAARLSDERFLVGTTGAGAARVADWLEEWLQCEWPGLEVLVAPVTTAWAVMTLSGPAARAVLSRLDVDVPLDPGAFPHMAFRQGRIGGVPARVARVSFTGEVSFEISLPTAAAPALWRRMASLDPALGVTPVGIDAWMLLRTEKGYLHVGADTDGTTSALDVGWGHILKRRSDFIGRRSLMRPADVASGRPQFVGVQALDRSAVLPVGAHLQCPGGIGSREGYVTSSGWSPVLERGVALGMVRDGRARFGAVLEAVTPAGPVAVRVVEPGAYDPDGTRLHG